VINPNDTFIKIEAIRESQRALEAMVEAAPEIGDDEAAEDVIHVG
jgi:hypothetical protein